MDADLSHGQGVAKRMIGAHICPSFATLEHVACEWGSAQRSSGSESRGAATTSITLAMALRRVCFL